MVGVVGYGTCPQGPMDTPAARHKEEKALRLAAYEAASEEVTRNFQHQVKHHHEVTKLFFSPGDSSWPSSLNENALSHTG